MVVKTNGFTVPEELMKLLLKLASKWGDDIDKDMIKVVHLSGAMTNEVYRISWATKIENDPRTVLVRIYGEGVELFFNREEEIRTFESISKLGQGPRLLGCFSEGRVEEFIHARTLSAGDLREPEISGLIAAKLKEFHNLNMPGKKKVILWDRMRNWVGEAKSLCSSEHYKDFCLDALEEEINILEKEISCENQEVKFCHNDLQYGNIMINDKTKSITLIDFEYASYNPVAYDLANHFCEMAANYHTDTPHVLDYNVYPNDVVRSCYFANIHTGSHHPDQVIDEEERERFVRGYLNSAGKEPSDAEVRQLMDDAEKFSLANHLFWGLWGIISGYVNSIDFDYMEYARQRFEQYWLKKPKILGTPKLFTNEGSTYESL